MKISGINRAKHVRSLRDFEIARRLEVFVFEDKTEDRLSGGCLQAIIPLYEGIQKGEKYIELSLI